MNRKIRSLILIGILAMLLCSCNSNDNEYEPDYQIFKSDENVYDEPNTYTDKSSDLTGNITGRTESKNVNNSLPISTEEEQWPYPLEYEGVTPSGNNKAGNLSVNMKNMDPNLSYFICPDSDNNITYYINYGRDNYLYKLKNGARSLLLEKEVYFLQLWDNKLYFLCKNEKSDILSYGDIYTYNLEESKTELLKEANARKLIIDSYGIYYEEMVDNDLVYYRLDHDGRLIERLNGPYIQSYYNYQLIANDNGVFLYDTTTNEEFYLAPRFYYPYVKIYNDYFIINDDGAFYILNLLNGEKKILRFFDKKDCPDPVDYIIIDNIAYFHHSWRINLDNGECFNYGIRPPEEEKVSPYVLYTDETKIYSLVIFQYSSGSIQKMLEISLDDKEYILTMNEIGG